jgi:hypothetical protein
MPTATQPISPDEVERLGEENFKNMVRPNLRPEDNGKFVAIDVVSGGYEIDTDDYMAVMRLEARIPDAEIWLLRAGYPTAYKFAGIRCR